jgi:hypothetical protein
MKKRDYKLVINGKYNMKAIMQRAWVYVRNYGYSLKSSLKMSWVDARLNMDEYKSEKEFIESGKPLFPNKNLSISDLYSDPLGNLTMGYVSR